GSTKVVIPPRGRQLDKWLVHDPGYFVFYQQGGGPGDRESAGGLMVSAVEPLAEPAPPVEFHVPGTIRSSVTATVTAKGIRAIALNQGPSHLSIAAGGVVRGGGGAVPEPAFETEEKPLAPDLALASCALS